VALRIVVDYDTCITSGMCTSIAPEIFEIGDDGTLKLLMEVVPPDLLEKAESAVLCCPVEALSLAQHGE
jgi:ferredoxin